MSERKVVITGMGLLTPLGKNVEENWKNLLEMKGGIEFYPEVGPSKNLQYMGKIKELEMPENIPHKLFSQMKFLNRGSLLGFVSAYEAMIQSSINISMIPPSRRALYIASGDFTSVGYDFMFPAIKDGMDRRWQEMNFEKLNRSALDKVNPFFLLESINNNLFSFLSAFFELMGPNTSLATLSPYGVQALELAYRSIKQDKADIALVVGCGSWITEIPLYELEGIGMLSKCNDGKHSFKPFDRYRDGFLPGEGGAAVLLEGAEIAKERGADILGGVDGFGNCIEFSNGHGLSIPPKVSKRSIKMALEESGCDIKDLSFINPHGSATRKGDRSELRSLMDILNDYRSRVPICGMKSYTGHLGAASDIGEIIFGIKAIKNKILPATLNFRETEKEFSELKISSSHQKCERGHFLSISYGMGGQSSSVIINSN